MNISNVKVALTGSDLLSMLNEFVKVEGLNLEKVEIKDEIRLYGSFTKGITINFMVGVKVSRVENGIIHGEVTAVKVAKLSIFSLVRKAALKFALKALEDMGITYNKGKVVINIKRILKDIPYIDLNIADIYFAKELLNVEVSDINISIMGTIIKEDEISEEEREEESEEDGYEDIEKIKDHYSNGRSYLEKKLPVKIKSYSDYLFIIPDMAALIYRLLKDKRVSLKTKLIIAAAVSYIAFPTDIIPDKIPFVGKVDEIAVAFFALERIISDVPMEIILENWEGKNNIVFVIRNILDYVINFTGAKNVEKVYNFVEEIVSL